MVEAKHMIHNVKKLSRQLEKPGEGRVRMLGGGKKKESILAEGREGDMGGQRRQGQKGTLTSVHVCSVSK